MTRNPGGRPTELLPTGLWQCTGSVYDRARKSLRQTFIPLVAAFPDLMLKVRFSTLLCVLRLCISV